VLAGESGTIQRYDSRIKLKAERQSIDFSNATSLPGLWQQDNRSNDGRSVLHQSCKLVLTQGLPRARCEVVVYLPICHTSLTFQSPINKLLETRVLTFDLRIIFALERDSTAAAHAYCSARSGVDSSTLRVQLRLS
jgi:hypothetical protein